MTHHLHLIKNIASQLENQFTWSEVDEYNKFSELALVKLQIYEKKKSFGGVSSR